MKRKNTKVLIVAVSILVLGIQTYGSFAQGPLQKNEQSKNLKPFMWLPNNEMAEHRRDFGSSRKLVEMSKKAGLNGTLLNDNVDVGKFWDLVEYLGTSYSTKIKYLHMYLGLKNQKIVIIFGAGISVEEDSDLEFILVDGSFETAPVKTSTIAYTEKKGYCDAFVNAMYLSAAEQQYVDNYYPNPKDPKKVASDTRFITHCWEDVLEFQAAYKFLVSKNPRITKNAKVVFGTYSSLTGATRGTSGTVGHYKNRLTTSIELVDANNTIIPMEADSDFDLCDWNDKSACLFYLKSEKDGGNNGQLCPTNCH